MAGIPSRVYSCHIQIHPDQDKKVNEDEWMNESTNLINCISKNYRGHDEAKFNAETQQYTFK